MKIAIVIFLILGLLACDVEARDKWTKEDTIRQVIFTGLTIVDWRQSRYASGRAYRYYERNPAMGKHPTARKTNTYFLSSTILHAAIGYYLPSRARKIWQYSGIAVEYNCVFNNFTIGLRADF